MDTPTKRVNRINDDLKVWDRLEQQFTKRFGSDMWNDRASQKAKAGIFRHILNKYRGKTKTPEEKAAFKMLRHQHRLMQRKLYPNAYIRLLRNVGLFALNVIKLGLKTILNPLWKVLKFLINPTLPIRKVQADSPAQQQNNQQNNANSNSQQQGKNNSQDNKQKQQQKGSQKKSTGQKQGAAAQKGQTATKQQPAAQKNGTKQQPAAKNGQTTGKQQPAAKNGQATGKQQPAAQKQNQQGQRTTAKIHNLNPRQMSQPVSQGRGMHR